MKRLLNPNESDLPIAIAVGLGLALLIALLWGVFHYAVVAAGAFSSALVKAHTPTDVAKVALVGGLVIAALFYSKLSNIEDEISAIARELKRSNDKGGNS